MKRVHIVHIQDDIQHLRFAISKPTPPSLDVPERIVIPPLPEFATVKSSALVCPSVVVPKSNLPDE